MPTTAAIYAGRVQNISSGGDFAWADPSNATGAEDDTDAVVTSTSGGASDDLWADQFDFSGEGVPSDAVITAILFEFRRKTNDTGLGDVSDTYVYPVIAGSALTGNNLTDSSLYTDSLNWYGYNWPSITDLYGSDLSNTAFGVTLKAAITGALQSAEIDAIRITVTWSGNPSHFTSAISEDTLGEGGAPLSSASAVLSDDGQSAVVALGEFAGAFSECLKLGDIVFDPPIPDTDDLGNITVTGSWRRGVSPPAVQEYSVYLYLNGNIVGTNQSGDAVLPDERTEFIRTLDGTGLKGSDVPDIFVLLRLIRIEDAGPSSSGIGEIYFTDVSIDHTPMPDDANVDVQDTLTLNENSHVASSGTVDIAVSDSVNVSSTTKQLLQSFIAISEPLTLSETTAMQVPAMVDTSELTTVTDSVATSRTLFLNVSETATLAESVSRLLESGITRTEAITLSESTNQTLIQLLRLIEQPTVSSSVSVLPVSFIQGTENVTATEFVVATPPSGIFVSDNLVAVDTTVTGITSFATKTDAATVVDSSAVTVTFRIDLNIDNLSLTFVTNVDLPLIPCATDTLTVSDVTAAGGVTSFIAVAEYQTLSESIVAQPVPLLPPTTTFSAEGRIGVSVAQPESGNDFPLVNPSEDIRYLLADAYLAYDDPSNYSSSAAAFIPPFRIRWIYFAENETAVDQPEDQPEPTHIADVLIVDAEDNTVFDSTTVDEDHFSTQSWGDRLKIYSWEADGVVCRIVRHTAWSPDLTPTPRFYDTHIIPDDAVLDERAVERLPKRVRSLRVVLSQLTGEHVRLTSGYNMDLELEEPITTGHRARQQIVLNATVGAGAGIYPGCVGEALVIKRVNNVPPSDAGDFFLSAADCYALRQPTTLIQPSPRLTAPTPAMLKFSNNCKPCCACDDYVEVAEYMNQVGQRYIDLGQTFNGIRDLYHENKQRWEASQGCITRKPLRLALVPQVCPFLDVGLQFCNQSADCKRNVVLTIDFTGTTEAALGVEVPGFTTISGASFSPGGQTPQTERYVMDGSWPIFKAYWDSVQPFSAVSVRFRLEFNNCGMDGESAYLIKAYLYGTTNGDQIEVSNVDGDPEAAAAYRELSLNCPAQAGSTKNLSGCAT